jgi:hypothetical protein
VSQTDRSTTGSITAGTAPGNYTLTVADSTGFAAGKEIVIAGAGVGGGPHKTIIASVSGNTVYLTFKASTTVTGAAVIVPGNLTYNAAPYFDKATLSVYAKNMHQNQPTAKFSVSNSTTADFTVNFNASGSLVSGSTTTTCAMAPGECTFAWAFGDGATGTGMTTSHLYSGASASYVATLTVVDGTATSTKSKTVTPVYVAATPTSVTGTVTASGFTATANWTVAGGVAPYRMRIKWGDGTDSKFTQLASGASTTTHTYVYAGTYAVTVAATDSGSNGSNMTTSSFSNTVTVSGATISGLVTSSTGTPVGGAYLYLLKSTPTGTVTKKISVSNTTGTVGAYSMTNVNPGVYTLTASKSGYTFAPAAVDTTTGSVIVNMSATTP